MMVRTQLATVLLLFSSLFAYADNQGEGPLKPAKPTSIAVEEVIHRFAAKEKDFKLAREYYTFRQSVKVQAMDGDTVKDRVDAKGVSTTRPQPELDQIASLVRNTYSPRHHRIVVATIDVTTNSAGDIFALGTCTSLKTKRPAA